VTPADLARIHASAFRTQRPWSAAEFESLLSSPHVFVVAQGQCFALGRVVVDEVELLTIATAPTARRMGAARAALALFETEAKQRGALVAHLEVAADNTAALGLYRSAEYSESGRRRGYYPRENTPAVDAIILHKALT